MPHILRSNEIIGQWEPPLQGTLYNLPIFRVPYDALSYSENVFLYNGFLERRPGMSLLTGASGLTGRPTGLYSATRPDKSVCLVIGTVSNLYCVISGALTDLTGPALTASSAQLAQFASIALGSPQALNVVHANGKDTPQVWDGNTANNFATIAGAPTWTDVANIDEHIVGITPPYDITWCDTQSVAAPPAANSRVLSDTGDALVAIVPLGVSTGVVYKQRSIWLMTRTGSYEESSYFRLDYQGDFDGPAGPGAIVQVDGGHMYMTTQGRIAFYNGSQHRWVGDGILGYVAPTPADGLQPQIGAAYDMTLRTAVFTVPFLISSTEYTQLAFVKLPSASDGHDFIAFGGYAGNIGVAPIVLTAGGTSLEGDGPALFARSTGRVLQWLRPAADTPSDDGTGFQGSWITGLVASPGLEFYGVDAFETLISRGGSYGSLTVNVISSYAMQGLTSTAVPTAIDLTATGETTGSPRGADVRGRFFGLQYSWGASAVPNRVRWSGSRLSAKLRVG